MVLYSLGFHCGFCGCFGDPHRGCFGNPHCGVLRPPSKTSPNPHCGCSDHPHCGCFGHPHCRTVVASATRPNKTPVHGNGFALSEHATEACFGFLWWDFGVAAICASFHHQIIVEGGTHPDKSPGPRGVSGFRAGLPDCVRQIVVGLPSILFSLGQRGPGGFPERIGSARLRKACAMVFREYMRQDRTLMKGCVY